MLGATQQIRLMRGGAQAHMMLASDNNFYIVKFQNNPQHLRVLANEMFATRLAEAVGLRVPKCDIIEVSDWLIKSTPELEISMASLREPCKAGIQFASRFIGGLMPGMVVDYLPEEMLADVKNVSEFAGMLAFDKWTSNVDGRQAVYSKSPREKTFTATFIDHGYCFNAGTWRFQDTPLRGVYARNAVYENVTGWKSFEPWLERMESMSPEVVWNIARTVPPEWYGSDQDALDRLVENLLSRRGIIRDLIDGFRTSSRQPFPKWKEDYVRLPAYKGVPPPWRARFFVPVGLLV
jgi:hypothetical protein